MMLVSLFCVCPPMCPTSEYKRGAARKWRLEDRQTVTVEVSDVRRDRQTEKNDSERQYYDWMNQYPAD